ncbi:MAG: AzlD domain-containing protein [Eubacteriaceae bacterium]|nr:AzlD domain-containing protein [Eubacteriaceae bacterium]
MTTGTLIGYIVVMAGVTYAIRVIPLVLCQRQITNVFVRSFLYYIPYAVLGAMTIPAIFYATSNMVSATVGLIAAVILSWQRRSLITVAVFACVAVLITEWIQALI